MASNDSEALSSVSPISPTTVTPGSPSSARVQFPATSPSKTEASAYEWPTQSLHNASSPPNRVPPFEVRKRVRSTDAYRTNSATSVTRVPHSTTIPSPLGPSRRKAITQSRKGKEKAMEAEFDLSMYDVGIPGVTDDYFTRPEDPQVAEEVARALKAKERREARSRAKAKDHGVAQESNEQKDSSLSSKPLRHETSDLAPPTLSKPIPRHASSQSTTQTAETASSGDPDEFLADLYHPNLTPPETHRSKNPHERRWERVFSRSKRKHTDKPSSPKVEEPEEETRTDRLQRIRNEAKPFTLERVKMIQDQFQRRYDKIYTSIAHKEHSANIMDVMRWRRSVHTRPSADPPSPASEAEAKAFHWLPWLAELHVPRTARRTAHTPWHLTALFFEEFDNQRPAVHSPGVKSLELDVPPPAEVPSTPPRISKSPRSNTSSPARPSPGQSLEAPSTPIRDDVRRSSLELFDSGGTSKSSKRKFRMSLPGVLIRESAKQSRSSLLGSAGAQANTSPSSSRLHLGNLLTRRRVVSAGEEEPVVGSARASNTDPAASAFNSEDGSGQENRVRGPHGTTPEIRVTERSATDDGEDQSPIPSRKGAKRNWLFTRNSVLDADEETKSEGHIAPPPSEVPDVLTPRGDSRQARRVRISVPPPIEKPSAESMDERRRRIEAQEKQLDQEYDERSRLLAAIDVQNERTQRLLHSVGRLIRDYIQAQTSLAESLDVPFEPFPVDVQQSLRAMALPARTFPRVRGWRAVDETHERREQQLRSLQQYMRAHTGDEPLRNFVPRAMALMDSLPTLAESLDSLSNQRKELVERTAAVTAYQDEVMERLEQVKAEQDVARDRFAVPYPEEAAIASLELSIREPGTWMVRLGKAISTPLEYLLHSIFLSLKYGTGTWQFGRLQWVLPPILTVWLLWDFLVAGFLYFYPNISAATAT